MSVVKPCIDDLLEKTDHNRFLLASLASKRACDINNMIRGQHLRVAAIQDFDDITTMVSGKDTGFPVPIPSRWLWTRLSTATSLTTRPVTRRRSATRLLKPKWRLASAWSTITRLD